MDGEYGRVQEDSEGLGLSKQKAKQDLSWAGKIQGAKAGGDGNDGEQAWRHWRAGFETAIVHGNGDGRHLGKKSLKVKGIFVLFLP